MASSQAIFVMSLLMLGLAFNPVTAGIDKLEHPVKKALHEHGKSIVVEGMVYCQSCKVVGTGSLSEAVPISGAKVSVTCTNHENHVFYYNTFITDYDGYFYAKLESFTMEHQLLDHPLTSCKVRIVSSPISSCNVLTNVNDGINGASLRYEHKRMNKKKCDTVIYATGPFAFRPSECPAHY